MSMMRNDKPDPTRPAEAGEAEQRQVDVDSDVDRRDLLLSRIVDGEADSVEWQAFEAMAAQDEALWRELATAQRHHAMLGGAMNAAIGQVPELPLLAAASFRSDVRAKGAHAPSRPWTALLAPMSGWLAAAGLALAWTWWMTSQRDVPLTDSIGAGVMNVSTKQEALDAYLTLGQKDNSVLGELPQRVLVSVDPREDGQGYLVTYERRIIEQQIVKDLLRYTGSSDEIGRPGLQSFEPGQDRPATRGRLDG